MASSYYKLNIQERTTTGGKHARAMLREGQIPAILYYAGTENVNLSIDKIDLFHALHSGQHIFEIESGGETQFAMIKQMQYHPVSDDVIHLDLMRVRRSEKISITVPLVLEGESIGVKEGGVLSQQLVSIEIKCYPTDVPEQILVDVSGLELNTSLSVSDVDAGDDEIEIVTSADINVASVHPPASDEEPETDLEEGELDEDAPSDDSESEDTSSDGDSGEDSE